MGTRFLRVVGVVGLVAFGAVGGAWADARRVREDPSRALSGICARGTERLAAGDVAGALAVLEEAVRAVPERRDVPPDVAADCLVGLAEVVERDVDRPAHVDEAASLYQRSLALRPDPAIRARLALVGTLASLAGPFADSDAAVAHLAEVHCANDAGCRVWLTRARTNWSGASIREARIAVASTGTEGARAYVLLVTDAGVFVMPPVVTALTSQGMSGGVGGSVEHRAVLAGSGRQVVARLAAFRDFAERWEAARPTVQRIVVCDLVEGVPRCTQPFEEAAAGRSGRDLLDLPRPGHATIRREGADAQPDDEHPFDDLRCAPWLFGETRCPAP